jgi:DNA-binding transcriptional MerR regulator
MPDSVKKKPFYRNVDDTIEDVGITRRQLSYWQKQGIFEPELGSSSKKFTLEDTDRLRFLKNLIENLGLPIGTVRRLVASATEGYDQGDLFSPTPNSRTFIDVKTTRLVYGPDAMAELVSDALITAKRWQLERLLDSTLLLALQSAWSRSPNRDVYEAHVKSVHDRIERIDLVSRLRQDIDGRAGFWPTRDSDPALTAELIANLIEEKQRLEKELNDARTRKYWQ